MPKISVIMPVYNAQKYIRQSIGCILDQTFKDFELILIDDCGTDGSREIINCIEDSRIRIISNEINKGIAVSRNIGLQEATGEYIALLDDDDLSPLNRFELQNCFLDENKDIDVVGGRYQIIDEEDRCLKVFSEPLNNPEYIKAYMMFYDPIANGTAMMRRKMIENNGLKYKDGCLGMEDYQFWIDCSLCARITNLPEILLSWRQTSTNETSRSFIESADAREKKFAILQQYALQRNGFSLIDEDLLFFNRMFRENIRLTTASRDELEQLYLLLNEIIRQADEMCLNNKHEIRTVCKKMFSLRLENSEIWK